jgi:ABC-type glycerol-3-phosphate transport system substrate-binding protein
MRRVLAGAFAAAIALSAVPGFAQDKLTVWWVKGFYKSEDDALYAAIRKYEQKTGVKVELSQYAVQDMNAKSVAALDAGTVPDIAYSDTYDVQTAGKWAFDGKLEDLTDVLAPMKDRFEAVALSTASLYNDKTKKKAYYASRSSSRRSMSSTGRTCWARPASRKTTFPAPGRNTGPSGATRSSRASARRPASVCSAPASRWAWSRPTPSSRS